jgi:hypothetical protein
VGRGQRWLPARMVLSLLAGPGANLVVAAVAAGVASDPSWSVGTRSVAAGVSVAGIFVGGGNLIPLGTVPASGLDGPKALRWLVRPAAERARVQLALDLARLRAGASLSPSASSSRLTWRDQLRASVADPRAEVAVAAMTELMTRRPRGDDGWQDADHVAAFAARPDVAGSVRAALTGNYALSLAAAGLRTGTPSDPQVTRVAELAELARAADQESIQARTAYALARIAQGRPADARAVLIDVPVSASAELQARALAVRGIAEVELGDRAQAERLGAKARSLSPGSPLVRMLDAALAGRRDGKSGAS